MSELYPGAFVVVGSESDVIKDYLTQISEERPIIRLYHRVAPSPHPNCVDISDVSQLKDAIHAAGQRFSRIGMLCAAAVSQQKLFTELGQEEISEIIQNNIQVHLGAMKQVLPFMIRSRFGRVVYLSSIRSEHFAMGTSVYGASKGFMERAVSNIGREYGRLNITSVSLRLGFVDGGFFRNSMSEADRAKALRQVPLRRVCSKQELASALDLCFTNAYLNGAVIPLDGGFSGGAI